VLRESGWTIVPAAFFLLLNFSFSQTYPLFFSRLIYFSFLVTLFIILRRIDLSRILPLIIGGISIIVFIYGLIQKLILFPYYLKNLEPGEGFFSHALLTRVKSGRIFSIFTLPTLYAIVCAVLILFIFHYMIKASSKKSRIAWGILLVLGLFNLVMTQSFGGVLYLSVGILLYLVLSRVIQLKYLALPAMVLAFFFFLVTGLRFSEARELEPVKLRWTNWTQAGRMIQERPFLGQGLGNYESRISSYTQPGEARSIYAHNFFLQFLAEFGILGTLFCVLLIMVFKKKSWWQRIKAKENLLYVSALSILVFYNFIDIGFYFFSAGLAGTLCLSQIYRFKEKKIPLGPVAPVFFVLISLLLVLQNISDNFQGQGDLSLNSKDFAQATRDYKKSLAVNPYNIRSLMGSASTHFMKGDRELAETYLDRALVLYPDSPNANYFKSQLLFKKGRYFSSLYHASVAYKNNKINRKFKRWYESVTNRLQVRITGPGN